MRNIVNKNDCSLLVICRRTPHYLKCRYGKTSPANQKNNSNSRQTVEKVKCLSVQQRDRCAEIVRNLLIRVSVEWRKSTDHHETEFVQLRDRQTCRWGVKSIACVKRTVRFKLVVSLKTSLRTSTIVTERSTISINQQRIKNRQSSVLFSITRSRHQFIFDYSSKHYKFLLCYKLLLR